MAAHAQNHGLTLQNSMWLATFFLSRPCVRWPPSAFSWEKSRRALFSSATARRTCANVRLRYMDLTREFLPNSAASKDSALQSTHTLVMRPGLRVMHLVRKEQDVAMFVKMFDTYSPPMQALVSRHHEPVPCLRVGISRSRLRLRTSLEAFRTSVNFFYLGRTFACEL